MSFLILIALIATFLSFIFVHMNYRKYAVFTMINELLTFKKMIFNKKKANCAGKKTTVSFFFLINILIFLYSPDIFDLEDNFLEIAGSIFAIIILILILRLIYEFVVIPISVSNHGTANAYQQNTYMQMQPPLQQNYSVTQNEINIHNQPQQISTNQIPTETSFQFCSQCGTRYNASESKCPNCGMH